MELTNHAESSKINENKTLKYKPNGMWGDIKSSSENLVNLDKFLENEKLTNATEPWSKLDKTAKIKKLTVYALNYKIENNLSEEEYNKLITFFKDCLDKKRLARVKDIHYNKENGEIKEIPALFFNKQSNHFTLKNLDKRVSTLKGLAPKKKQGTVKNVRNDDNNSDSEDDN